MEDWHALEKKEVLRVLESNEEGISDKEASTRLEKYGYNELKQISKLSSLQIFLEQFKSIFILILIFAALFSLFIRHYIDFSVISAIVLLNSAIGFFQQFKAEKTISEMKSMLVPQVKVLRNNILKEIPSSEIVPGDVLFISEGDKIMADCRILHENNLEMNEAILTGESFPQKKGSEKINSDTELANRENMIYMGTTAVKGNAKAIVVSTGMNTEFGKIAGLVQKTKPEKTPLEKKLDDFSKKVALVVIALSALMIIIGILRGEETSGMILTGIALAISVIPEGVPAIIAITLALAIKRMGKHNALIRKLPAAETLGRTTVICTDKTGTLTEEEMTVTELFCNNDSFKINDNSFFYRNKRIDPLKSKELVSLLRIGILCNNARIEKDGKIKVYGDPTERALIWPAEKAGILKKEETEKEKRVIEYSFSSKRKLMSIIRENDKDFISYVKGAPDVILKNCTHELIGGRVAKMNSKRRMELHAEYEEMALKALRVLGFAYKHLDSKFNQDIAESNLIFAGFQGMLDPPRKEVKKAIEDCMTAGIKVKMITGDSLITARAISKMIGLEGESIESKELEKLSEIEFNKAVKEINIFARITPELKLKIIQTLKKQGEIVAVTGDGVNDILALKESHIGVAMGIRGTDVARDVSDIILLDDNFSSIVNAIREGRKVYDNMKKSIKAHLAANANELFLVLVALLFSLPIPLLPLAILWMNLITDSLPSLALCIENEEENIMKRKPINPKETILKDIWGFTIISGILCFIITGSLFLMFYKADLEKARTIVLTAAVFCEMFAVLSCRSDKNMWKIGFFSNKFLIGAIITAILLQMIVVYTPLSIVFGFKALPFLDLLLIIVLSPLVFIFFEIKKFISAKK